MLEEAHPEDMEPVDDNSRDTVEGSLPRQSPSKTPYPSPQKGKTGTHQPPQTPRRKPAMRSVTPPPPPKKVMPRKRPSPKDLENYKKFKAEVRRAQVIEDLQMSSDPNENDENEVGSCNGRNRIFPANDPRSEVSGEDPEVNAQSDPKHANPQLEKRVEDPEEVQDIRRGRFCRFRINRGDIRIRGHLPEPHPDHLRVADRQ